MNERFAGGPKARTWPRVGLSDALGLLVSLGLAAVSFTYPYGRDQASFAYIAREWGMGNVPYKAAFEIKPPSIYLTYLVAFRIFGDTPWAIRVFDYLFALVPAGIACAYAATPADRPVPRGRIGLSLAIVSLVYYLPFDFWNTAQCESFTSALSVIAAAAALRSRDARVSGFVVGLASALAVLFKPTVGIVAAGNVAVLALAMRARHAPLSDYLRAAVTLTVGVALPIAAIFGYFAKVDGLGAMHEALVVTIRHYLTAGKYVHGTTQTLRALVFGVLGWQALLVLAANVLLFRGVPVLLRARPERGLPFVAAGIGLVTSITSVVVQLKFFNYHWLSAVGFVALTLLVGIVDLQHVRVRRARGEWLVASLAISLLLASGKQSARLFYTAKTALYAARHGDDEPLARSFGLEGFYSYWDSRETALWVKERAAPGDTRVVRGFEPQIYMLCDMRYGGRFFETPWLTEERFSPRTKENTAEDWAYFRKSPPRWVVAFTHLESGVEAAKSYVGIGYVPRARVSVFTILERGENLRLPEEVPW